jgi:LmbE family N-acetylglucosaminyl deacetylase
MQTHRKKIANAMRLLVGIPAAYLSLMGAAYLVRSRAAEMRVRNLALPVMRPEEHPRRILLFSPHPDDETLGAGGLLQQAAAERIPTRVVFLTSGDGFRVAVERQLRESRLQPEDYIRFAELRHEETGTALRRLGLPTGAWTFLGFPDRGLMALWNTHWEAQAPFRSAYTKRDRPPYRGASPENGVYCGNDMLNAVMREMSAFRPTEIYITHPSDDHPDHAAGSAFVSLALQLHRAAGQPWAQRCLLRYYLVHRGDWPVPQGLDTNEPMAPPAEMTALDTSWEQLPLSTLQTNRKLEAIEDYRSQTAVTRRFLTSFARRNELFAQLSIPQAPTIPDGSLRIDGSPADWMALSTGARDPIRDNLLRDFEPGADVRALRLAQDSKSLYLLAEMAKPTSNRVRTHILLRTFRFQNGKLITRRVEITLPDGEPQGVCSQRRDNCIEIAVPKQLLGMSDLIAVLADTSVARVAVDSTGIRLFRL